MIRRPAVTLIEVLVSMFIMAIGMLALLVLFPLGAVSMGQALKDDRCASTAAMAENVAIGTNLRHDPNVAGLGMVYVDPYGFIQAVGPVGGFIPRVSPSFVGASPQLADRWFSLPDDIAFLENGTPDTVSSGGLLDRGRRYSYAYLLVQLPPSNLVQMYVVVYSGRPVGVLTPEPTYPVAAVISTNGLQLAAAGTSAKRGGWILDSNGNFYRISNIVESGGTTVLETQQNLQLTAGQNITIMDYAVEVFNKGTSWQP